MGRLEHDFSWVHCESCHLEQLLASGLFATVVSRAQERQKLKRLSRYIS